jgi:hypothetical protein
MTIYIFLEGSMPNPNKKSGNPNKNSGNPNKKVEIQAM